MKGKKIMLIVFAILMICMVTNSVSAISLEWTNQYCDIDLDCAKIDSKSICITKYTSDDIFSLSSKSDVNIITAEMFDKLGKCAKVYYQNGDDRFYYDKYVGTQSIPSEVIEEILCPVCENKTITVTEYINVTNPVQDETCENNTQTSTIFLVVSPLFTVIFMGLVFYYQRKVKKLKIEFNEKIAKVQDKIREADNIKKRESFAPGLNARIYNNSSIKQLSVEEMNKKIKDSENKRK